MIITHFPSGWTFVHYPDRTLLKFCSAERGETKDQLTMDYEKSPDLPTDGPPYQGGSPSWLMKTKPKSGRLNSRFRNIVIDGIKYHEPPVEVIHALEKESAKSLEIAELVCWLFDVPLGSRPEPLIGNKRIRLGDIAGLPKRLRHHARKYIEWATQGRLLVGEVICARIKVIEGIVKLRVQSDFGKRRLRIVKSLRRECTARPESANSSECLNAVEILSDEIGRPLSPRTLRKIRAFDPSHVQILESTDPYCMLKLKSEVTVRLMRDGYSISSITMALPVEEAPRSRIIHGELEDFFETGTEGIIWAVEDDDDESYSGLHPIEEGDHLTIIAASGSVVWKGVISCDRKAGFEKYPHNPEYGQPQALGRWVHWTQKGFKPDDWARFFIRPDGRRLRAILRKRRQKAKGLKL